MKELEAKPSDPIEFLESEEEIYELSRNYKEPKEDSSLGFGEGDTYDLEEGKTTFKEYQADIIGKGAIGLAATGFGSLAGKNAAEIALEHHEEALSAPPEYQSAYGLGLLSTGVMLGIGVTNLKRAKDSLEEAYEEFPHEFS